MKEKVQELNFDGEVARLETNIFVFVFFLKDVFIHLRERECEREQARVGTCARVGGRGKELQLDFPLSMEP